MHECYLPSYGAISHLVGRAENYNAPGRKEKFNEDVKAQIRKDKAAGMKLLKIASKYDCSRRVVCVICNGK